MKNYLTIIIFCLFINKADILAQNNAGKFGLEITKFKIGINAGPYRGRTPQTDGPFNQGFSGFGQIYFPFQFSVDYRSNFSDSATITNEYNNRVFLLRPSALFHYVDNGSMAFGIGLQFSFLITKQVYLEYQLSGVYIEANKAGLPDLNDGFNLHHFVSISKPISRHFSLSLGFIHMSGAGLGNGKTSNQDVLTLGVKWNL
ncbi:MAG: hypothetical protein COA97_04615 [Flavobacteriales bacterium]|nr:MAG: hypothetical protein COA97_04615 [Flavobacteriales bacterium]